MRSTVSWSTAAFLALAPALHGQAPGTVVQFPLRLLDIGIEAHPATGVTVVAAPSVRSTQGADSLAVVSLSVHPDTLLDWLNHVTVVLGQPLVAQREERIQWSRELRAVDGSGRLVLGRSVRGGRLRNARWLAIGDSGQGWQVELPARDADPLVKLLLGAAYQAGFTEAEPVYYRSGTADVPVGIVHQPDPGFRRTAGRVVVRYVVATDGVADPETITVLLASDPTLADLARTAILQSRFTPAMHAGQPVRQLVQQVIRWQAR